MDLDRPGTRIANFNVMAEAQGLKPCEHVAVRMDIPEPVVRQPEHHAIAGNAAAMMTHQAIPAPVYGHGADRPREHIVKERRRIRPPDFQRDLRHIENARLGAQHPVLFDDWAFKGDGRQPPFVVTISGGDLARRLEPWRTAQLEIMGNTIPAISMAPFGLG